MSGCSIPGFKICDIGASMAVMCPLAPWKPSSVTVSLPVSQLSGEAADGTAAAAKPEVSDDEVERLQRYLVNECGASASQIINSVRGCQCGAPISPVSTLGELDTLFIEGLPCSCGNTAFCASCSSVVGDDSAGARCRNCGSEVHSIFAYTEVARR